MHYVGPLVIHIEVGTNIKVVYGCSVGDTNLSRGHKGGGTIKLYGVCGDISIGCNLMEVRCDIFQEGAITDEAGGIDVTGDIKDVGPRVIHIEVGTHVEVVHRCSVGDTNLSRGHKGGGTIKLQGVCGDISIGGNLVKVRSDILQKSTITHKTGGIDVTSDMEDIGPLVIHIEVGTHIEVVHRCSVGDTNLSRGHERGGTIKLQGVCGDISIGCNFMEVRSDIFQKGTITHETGGIDITSDMEDVGSLVIHI